MAVISGGWLWLIACLVLFSMVKFGVCSVGLVRLPVWFDVVGRHCALMFG